MSDISTGTTTSSAEPGYTTTEFWVTLLTLVMPAVTLIFHRDFSTQIQVFSVAAAGLASAVYAIARTFRKAAADHSVTSGTTSTMVNPPAAASDEAALNRTQLNQIAAGMKAINAALGGPSDNGASGKSLVIVRAN